jgi:hypothetical protein
MTRKAATHRGLIGWGNVVLEQFRADAIRDCYRRAAEARRIADANSDTKSDFLEFERRWLTLVIGFKSDAELVVGCERKAG